MEHSSRGKVQVCVLWGGWWRTGDRISLEEEKQEAEKQRG